MNQKKKSERASAALRLGAGFYLLYLTHGLFRDFKAGVVSSSILVWGSMIIFGIAGTLLVAVAGRYFYHHRKANQSEEETETYLEQEEKE